MRELPASISDFVERHETLNRQPPITVNNVLAPNT
jgi:hypothetical protein